MTKLFEIRWGDIAATIVCYVLASMTMAVVIFMMSIVLAVIFFTVFVTMAVSLLALLGKSLLEAGALAHREAIRAADSLIGFMQKF